MTVSAQTPINRSTGNGVTTVFPYDFKILAAADIQVTVDGVSQTLNVDYTVSGVGNESGGNVTMTVAPANLTSVVRRRNMALVRTTDYQDQGELPASTLDADIDAAVLMIQQVDEQIGRALTLPAGVAGVSAELPEPVAFTLLGWNDDGTAIENYPPLSAGGSDAALVTYDPARAGAVSMSVRTKLRESVSVKDFGAVGDGVTDDTAAFQLAITWLNAAAYRKLNGVSGETYKITSTLQLTQDSIVFDGNNCAFTNAITNKTPLFKLATLTQNVCTLENFRVNGSGTPGHVIAIFGGVAGSPSFITVSNISVSGNTGTGLNSSDSDVPSHFIWMEGGMTLRVQDCTSYVTGGGIHLLNVQKVLLQSTTIDGCAADRTLHVEGCRNVVIGDDCVFNAGYGDQCYFTGNTSVSINGNRFKGSLGRQIFADGVNDSIAIENNNFEVYSLTTSAVVIGTGTAGAAVRGNNFSLINSGAGTTFTQAVIDVVSVGSNVSYGGEITNNKITVNNLLTLANGIRLFASSNSIRGWRVEGNYIGNTATSAVITTGISLSGTQYDTRVINNTLGMSGSGSSMTTGISIGSGVNGAVVMGTQITTSPGTLISDSGVKTIRESSGVWETGTFTPVVYGGTTAGTASYSIQAGKYSKIGNLVFYNIALAWTGHTGTGDLRISGLPFPASATANQLQIGNCLASNLTFTGQLVAYASGGTSFLRVGNFASGGAFAFTPIDAAADLYITGVYEIV